jgi:hypothetical protein
MSHCPLRLLVHALLLACAGCASGGAVSAPQAPAPEGAAATAATAAPRSYEVRLETLVALPLAVARDRAWAGNIGPQILSLTSRLERLGFGGRGRDASVVIYFDGAGSDQWTRAPGIPIEVGFQLQEPLAQEHDGVFRSQTPRGTVAHTTHVGPYHQLGDAHAAIRDWCRQNGKRFTGVSWEVYDSDRSRAPEGLRTDVYYALE